VQFIVYTAVKVAFPQKDFGQVAEIRKARTFSQEHDDVSSLHYNSAVMFQGKNIGE